MGKVGSNAAKITPEDGVYVVRLSGDATGSAVARPEGLGASTADVGNTFTLGVGNPIFEEYISYSAIWMGDTAQDAPLEWNGLTYHAGRGSGTAGYAHSQLPLLSEGSSGEKHNDAIVLQAGPGAHIEFRFKVRES